VISFIWISLALVIFLIFTEGEKFEMLQKTIHILFSKTAIIAALSLLGLVILFVAFIEGGLVL
jgi:hypothetical protein